jgi:predicted GIY-YIG superfamily endonuclease
MNKGDILVYCIARDRSNTYVGWTNDWPRRLRQHNGAIKGGARSTGMRRDPLRPWRPLFLVTGFGTKRHARQLEWFFHAKHIEGAYLRKGETHVAWRQRRLADAFALDRFTKTAPVTATAGLTIHDFPFLTE